LVEPVKKSGGRNNTGKMTMRYIGGGHKQNIVLLILKETKKVLKVL
jgi:large subunit ribosomal protein L2